MHKKNLPDMMLKRSHNYIAHRIDNENGLKEHWIDTKGVLLVNFWSEWSVQCHHMAYVMRNIKPLLHDKDLIVYIDWHQHKGWVNKQGVFGVPTLIIYFAGQEIARFSGTVSEAVLMRHMNIISAHISDR
jgi:thioredoxin